MLAWFQEPLQNDTENFANMEVHSTMDFSVVIERKALEKRVPTLSALNISRYRLTSVLARKIIWQDVQHQSLQLADSLEPLDWPGLV